MLLANPRRGTGRNRLPLASHSPRHFLISDSRQHQDLLETEARGYVVVMQSHGVTLLKRPAP